MNEKYCHKLEKILRAVDLYNTTVGAWTAMEFEGTENIDSKLLNKKLEEYNKKLNHYVQVKSYNDELRYPSLYGLTLDHFNQIVEKKSEVNEEIGKLNQDWKLYFESEHLKNKISENSNPIKKFLPSEIFKTSQEK